MYLVLKSSSDTLVSSVFIGNEDIYINTSKQDFAPNLKLKGSTYNAPRYLYMQKIQSNLEKTQELFKQAKELYDIGKWNEQLEKQYFSTNAPLGLIRKQQQDFHLLITEFILENSDTDFVLKLLDLYKGNLNKKEITPLFNAIAPNLQKQHTYLSVQNHINNNYDLEPQEPHINFKALDAQKNDYEFSSAFTGKNVLLAFSSLYCDWCDKSVVQIDELSKTLKDKLEIVWFYSDQELEGGVVIF